MPKWANMILTGLFASYWSRHMKLSRNQRVLLLENGFVVQKALLSNNECREMIMFATVLLHNGSKTNCVTSTNSTQKIDKISQVRLTILFNFHILKLFPMNYILPYCDVNYLFQTVSETIYSSRHTIIQYAQRESYGRIKDIYTLLQNYCLILIFL